MPFTFNVQRLRDLAAEHGDEDQNAIAARTGIDAGSISRYLARKRQPGLTRAARIARAYGVQVDELTGAAPRS